MKWGPSLCGLGDVTARAVALSGHRVRLCVIPVGSAEGFELLMRGTVMGMSGDQVSVLQVIDGEVRLIALDHAEVAGMVPLRPDDPSGWNEDPSDEELGYEP